MKGQGQAVESQCDAVDNILFHYTHNATPVERELDHRQSLASSLNTVDVDRLPRDGLRVSHSDTRAGRSLPSDCISPVRSVVMVSGESGVSDGHVPADSKIYRLPQLVCSQSSLTPPK